MPNVRRSSTSRSIGVRSDFGISTPGEARSALDEGESDRDESVNADAEQYVDQYVESQVQRARSERSFGVYEDEFEAQA